MIERDCFHALLYRPRFCLPFSRDTAECAAHSERLIFPEGNSSSSNCLPKTPTNFLLSYFTSRQCTLHP